MYLIDRFLLALLLFLPGVKVLQAAPLIWHDGPLQRTLWAMEKVAIPAADGWQIRPSSQALDSTSTGAIHQPVFTDRPGDPDRQFILTPWLVVHFQHPQTLEEANAWGSREALTLDRQLGANAFRFHCDLGTGCIALANRLYHRQEVRYAYPDFVRPRQLRAAPFFPDDPLFSQQWHLEDIGEGNSIPGQDANIVPAWNTHTGLGVNIAIVDDGMEIDHEDLSPNERSTLHWDFFDDDTDPTGGWHGTRVAGIAAARGGNGIGVTGVAPEAGLAGLRLFDRGTDVNEATAFSHFSDQIEIYSNSWGPNDGGSTIEGPGPLAEAALAEGAANGRSGKGSIYLFAGGNGGSRDNANYDGYANSRFTIAVAAATNHGQYAWYSEPGANLLLTAPASGGSLRITTTAINNDYSFSFGGTSAAAPLVAGVVALMLEANPDLGWRDVQQILALSADQLDPLDPGWERNGGLHWVHHRYGYGRVDGAAAIATALNWQNVGREVSVSGQRQAQLPVPDDDSQGISSEITINGNLWVESVDVIVDASDHPKWGDLSMVLISPSGTESVLAETHSNGNGHAYDHWRFNTQRLLDEYSEGTWTLVVKDQAQGYTGTLRSWRLIVHGTVQPSPDCEGDPLTITGDFFNQEIRCVSASQITSTKAIHSAANVTFSAPQIHLLPGFRVESGSRFIVIN